MLPRSSLVGTPFALPLLVIRHLLKTILCLSTFYSCGPVIPINNPFEPSADISSEVDESPESGGLRILVLDVGQGDATLVIGPGSNGRTLLIDAGPYGQGITTVLPTLESLGSASLDWIVATHYDADHLGGIPEVLKGPDQVMGTEDDIVPAIDLLDRGDLTEKATPIFKDYIEIASSLRTEATPGTQLNLGEGAFAKVIVVNGHYSDGRSIHLNPDEENEASIGFLIQYGEFRYFTAGDLTGCGTPGGYETKDVETAAGEIIGDIDVLHVGHHGSETSTNKEFLKLTQPKAAIISVGKENDYGHPTESVLRRLEDTGIEIFRTDLLGTLEIRTDGQDFEINSD